MSYTNCKIDENGKEKYKEIYLNDFHQMMKNSAEVVREGEGKLNRLNEFILFCKKMGWKKIGISHCIASKEQGELLTDYLKKNNFEVFRCGCKVYEINKDEINILTKVLGKKEFSCNPCAQADILNRAGTEVNILLGPCIGHDMIIQQRSKAPCTTLLIKDRIDKTGAGKFLEYLKSC